ncbi:ompH family outer membrane protein [Canicola haemoglobinophilus]|uniref:OmpH family outer membrane protein n=1 Tax=Canicola haemoglobinophilus TaxID=733 RepID=A0AB38H7Z6_9PAST|nr:porin [Canicola haemoglobinophilus]STO55426.1 ompH family outer membrane protein [Canicola haemoglobinophilus]STO67754.1 ompH family outer membrane protein [Canicola haemoglobinophilus]
MKKTLIALAVAAVAATSANAAVVYQQDGTKVEVGGSIRLHLNKKTDKRADLSDNGSRIIVKGSHDLGEGLSVLGYTELGFAGELGSGGVTTRRLYAGIAHKDIGTLTFGKQLTTADNFGVADPTYLFGGVWAKFQKGSAYKAAVAAVEKEIKDNANQRDKLAAAKGKLELIKALVDDNFVTDSNKVIKFQSKSFNGFSVGADYVFGDANKVDANGDKVVNKNAYIVGLFYDNTFDGVNVKAEVGYTYRKLAEDIKAKSFKTGFGVGANGLFVGVDYARTKIADAEAIHAFQVGANYQFTEMAKVYTAYRHTKFDDIKEKGFAFGVGYKPHKLVETFVEYNTFKVSNLNSKRDNALYLGARVHF